MGGDAPEDEAGMASRPRRSVYVWSLIAIVVVLIAFAAYRVVDQDSPDAGAPPRAGASPGAPATSPPRPTPGSASPSPSATPSASPPPPAFGVQFHGTWEMYWDKSRKNRPNAMFWRHLDQLRDHGVTVLRVDVGWSASQPKDTAPSRGHWYNRRVATVLQAAADRGMRVICSAVHFPASRPNRA